MTPEQWKQVKALFQRVLELEISQQEDYLNINCTDDEVRKEIDSLLATHHKAENFLTPDKNAIKLNLSITKTDQDLLETNSFFTNMIGKKFNNTYQVEEMIGEGGMGAVFRCIHLLLRNEVAIKIMSPHILNKENYLKRFRREARVGWFLAHPNIIKVFEFSQSQDGLFFMVMEYFKGETLKHYIKRAAPIPFLRALEIIEPICNALEVTHKRKILHRDLKPANILIGMQDDEETIKLSDFGIIKLLEYDKQIAGEDTNLTQKGDIVGTVNYMSPEQLMNYNLTAASDIYSLGLILYEMLTGELPIVGHTIHETIMLKTRGEKLASITEKSPTLPSALDGVIEKTLSPNPAHRYQSVTDLINALKEIASVINNPDN